MKILASYELDSYYGCLSGLFVCEKEELEKAYGKELMFGECLGKHSCVTATFVEEDITILSEDEEFITLLISKLGNELYIGYNPLDYIEE